MPDAVLEAYCSLGFCRLKLLTGKTSRCLTKLGSFHHTTPTLVYTCVCLCVLVFLGVSGCQICVCVNHAKPKI